MLRKHGICVSICPWIGVKLSTRSNVSYQLVSWELSAPQLHREPARPCTCRGWDWKGSDGLFYNASWQFEWVLDDVPRWWEYKVTIARRDILINVNRQLRTPMHNTWDRLSCRNTLCWARVGSMFRLNFAKSFTVLCSPPIIPSLHSWSSPSLWFQSPHCLRQCRWGTSRPPVVLLYCYDYVVN